MTTEASRVLGREIWGYPKMVADISIGDVDDGVRVSVGPDGDRDERGDGSGDAPVTTTLTVRNGLTLPLDVRAASYSVNDGVLSRASVDLIGEVRVGVGGARLDIGDGAVGATLRELTVGRPVGQFVAQRLRAHVHVPAAVGGETPRG